MTETEANASSTGEARTGVLPGRPAGEPVDGGSAYQRIGGAVAVQAAVRIFYDRVLADPELAGYFESVEMAGQRRHLALMLTVLLGGPDTYDGRGLTEAHQGLGIPPAHYSRVGGYLVATLEWMDAPADVVDYIRAALERVEPQVVTRGDDPV
ncbi:hemoglobin [Micromonospora pisi]|uniref:Hemoglobin n=1 Tax=Micromonospora pisi TaxID=589240 RepID=A0A495JW31_9ACTN|nr:group 1 truncated hemoglobin [Micromonospora pisi]RKR93177.1 hemoglobin [Micromonospora pisi]